ncbi:FadR/GntR family transcriptional regulator [Leucobacter sp. wl10]|uniref:FadR/GntR family transcriptional regulator n=1 Tax=Leucobacter sp. wl10 TaxID=2304677 RepID=UPI000E5B1953|nr:FCD domain-containing protein [Leucobacter sp. wl10]RGE23326.1 FadR family transcriptional regulator [Leucobacter sp. wl10]
MADAAQRGVATARPDPATMPRVAAISRLSAVDTVRARLTLAINLGLLQSGERLPAADEMAESFGVSVASVKRGLAVLQQEGVVVRRAGRYGGSYVGGSQHGGHHGADAQVRSFLDDDSHVHTLIDERAVLEAGFAALAAVSRTEDEVAELRRLTSRMAGTRSWAEFRNLDRAFHRSIVEAARTPRAEAQAARVNAALDPYFLPYGMGLLHDSNREHELIADALADGDAGEAARLTAAHIKELHASMYVGLTNAG